MLANMLVGVELEKGQRIIGLIREVEHTISNTCSVHHCGCKTQEGSLHGGPAK